MGETDNGGVEIDGHGQRRRGEGHLVWANPKPRSLPFQPRSPGWSVHTQQLKGPLGPDIVLVSVTPSGDVDHVDACRPQDGGDVGFRPPLPAAQAFQAKAGAPPS